jgi:hypothetical protein
MDEGLREGLISRVPRPFKRTQRQSTLRLWLKRTISLKPFRHWLLVTLLGGGLLYYYSHSSYPVSVPLVGWTPDFKDSYGKTSAPEWKRRANAVKGAFVSIKYNSSITP